MELLTASNAGWLLGVIAMLWAFVKKNAHTILMHAAEAVAFAEKYYAGAPNDVLEAEAVKYFNAYWPNVPEVFVRLAIRKICSRRKARAEVLMEDA